jgi:hypothetical protein
MERVLSGLTWETCLVYLDDIIIFSRTFENHLANLREVFERLKEAHLKLSPKQDKLSKFSMLAQRAPFPSISQILGHCCLIP